MATVIEVRADPGGLPWRGAQKLARLHVAELDLPARETIEVALEDVLGAVELRKIIARKNLRGGISARRAHDARALVASHLDVNFLAREMGDREVEQQQLVLGRHPGHLGEDVGEAP